MNRKKWTRVLIVIVAGLWGYNIYKTVQNYQVKQETQEIEQSTNMAFTPIMFNKDTFDLVLPIEDPFLRKGGGYSRTAVASPSQNTQTSNTEAKRPKRDIQLPKAPKKWPEINYFGFLRNHEREDRLCLLSINGQSIRFSGNQTQKGVQLVQAYMDSVVVMFEGEIRTVLK